MGECTPVRTDNGSVTLDTSGSLDYASFYIPDQICWDVSEPTAEAVRPRVAERAGDASSAVAALNAADTDVSGDGLADQLVVQEEATRFVLELQQSACVQRIYESCGGGEVYYSTIDNQSDASVVADISTEGLIQGDQAFRFTDVIVVAPVTAGGAEMTGQVQVQAIRTSDVGAEVLTWTANQVACPEPEAEVTDWFIEEPDCGFDTPSFIFDE